MARRKPPDRTSRTRRTEDPSATVPVGLRIIGGRFRGRKLRYGGDPRVRPMKDRVRESVFNLVGPSVVGKHVLDLFGGTGALALEAISRGAARATVVEQHNPTAAILRENAATLGATEQVEVIVGNSLLRSAWQSRLGSAPWLVFCSPPYAFFVERIAVMLDLVAGLMDTAPPESVLVVEADERFDFGLLKNPEAWDVRPYPPAVVGIYRK